MTDASGSAGFRWVSSRGRWGFALAGRHGSVDLVQEGHPSAADEVTICHDRAGRTTHVVLITRQCSGRNLAIVPLPNLYAFYDRSLWYDACARTILGGKRTSNDDDRRPGTKDQITDHPSSPDYVRKESSRSAVILQREVATVWAVYE
jgi:hypothetical protein